MSDQAPSRVLPFAPRRRPKTAPASAEKDWLDRPGGLVLTVHQSWKPSAATEPGPPVAPPTKDQT